MQLSKQITKKEHYHIQNAEKRTTVNCGWWNIRLPSSNSLSVNHLVVDQHIDVLSLTDTGLQQDEYVVILTQNHWSKSLGGGAALFNFSLLLNHRVFTNLKAWLFGLSSFIVVIYCSPDSELLSLSLSKKSHCVKVWCVAGWTWLSGLECTI